MLSLPDIRRLIQALPEPSKSIVTLIVFASLRVGEVLALRWKRVQNDRLVIVERVYDGEFDEVKTDAGHREVPFDRGGVLAHTLDRCRDMAEYLGPEDLVFANRAGKPIDRHNLLNRQIKPTALELGLPKRNRLSELSDDAFEPDAADGSTARGHARQHGTRQYRRDAERLRAQLVDGSDGERQSQNGSSEGDGGKQAAGPSAESEPTAPTTPGGFGQVLDAPEPEGDDGDAVAEQAREWKIAVDQAENVANLQVNCQPASLVALNNRTLQLWTGASYCVAPGQRQFRLTTAGCRPIVGTYGLVFIYPESGLKARVRLPSQLRIASSPYIQRCSAAWGRARQPRPSVFHSMTHVGFAPGDY